MEPYHIPEDEKDFVRQHRIAYLIVAFIEDRLTPAERDELDDWVGSSNENLLFFEDATEDKKIKESIAWFQNLDMERARRRLAGKMQKRAPQPWYRTSYFAVAACIVLLVGIGLMFFVMKRQVNNNHTLTQLAEEKGTILTLANGKRIFLDSMNDGRINGTDEFPFNKDGSQISFGSKAELNGDNEMNTLTIPKGKHFSVVLSDGTIVELNSGSSLRFPYTFHNKERNVELEGEGYFEVSKSDGWSFVVNADETKVSVLGTKFNINGYKDEDYATITLIEGSVKASVRGDEVTLKPGEQTQYAKGGFQTQSHSDVEKALAWRGNQFIFRNTSLRNILKELEHWYGLDINDETQKDQNFNGTFDRDWPLEKIINYLEDTQRVRFELSGKKLTVKD